MSEVLSSNLAALTTMNRAELAERWVSAFACPAPRSCQAPLLRQALAWHAQTEALRALVGSRGVDRVSNGLRRAA